MEVEFQLNTFIVVKSQSCPIKNSIGLDSFKFLRIDSRYILLELETFAFYATESLDCSLKIFILEYKQLSLPDEMYGRKIL